MSQRNCRGGDRLGDTVPGARRLSPLAERGIQVTAGGSVIVRNRRRSASISPATASAVDRSQTPAGAGSRFTTQIMRRNLCRNKGPRKDRRARAL